MAKTSFVIALHWLARLILASCLSSLCVAARRPAASRWAVVQDEHFAVYSQAGLAPARAALAWFEELRTFFNQYGLLPQTNAAAPVRPPLAIIGFSSKAEYNSFQLRSVADAYYAGTSDRDFIVMPRLGADEFGIAAHEYAHFVMRNAGLHLPSWLSEGLAEVFSTVHMNSERCEIGGPLAQHTQFLQARSWLPASLLFDAAADSAVRSSPSGAALFYAESWAVADMLVHSPAYGSRFHALLNRLNSGGSTAEALQQTFGVTRESVVEDARSWIQQGASRRLVLEAISASGELMREHELTRYETRTMIGDLLLAIGMWDRAEQQFQALLRNYPGNAQLLASLGTVRLYKGDRQGAMNYWGKALDLNVADASLCYRYALLADEGNYPPAQVKRALTQAIANKPDFDEARYRLALLESNGGEYQNAVQQLRSMAKPSPARAFDYWSALANALVELGQSTEAVAAAQQASQAASTAAERAHAAELAYLAQTDLAVQFERGPDDQLRLITTRIARGVTDWNPFIEASDRLATVEGVLREVRCQAGALTAFVVASQAKQMVLAVPDPAHVLIQNGPPEFSCGVQPDRPVVAKYAATSALDGGLLRGLQFQ